MKRVGRRVARHLRSLRDVQELGCKIKKNVEISIDSSKKDQGKYQSRLGDFPAHQVQEGNTPINWLTVHHWCIFPAWLCSIKWLDHAGSAKKTGQPFVVYYGLLMIIMVLWPSQS